MNHAADTCDSPLKRVFRNSGWLLAGQIVSALMLICLVMLITQTLSLAEFGVYTLAITVAMTVIQLCDCRVWETLIKYIPYYQARDKPDQAAGIVQLCLLLESFAGLLAFAILQVGAGWISRLFGESLPDPKYVAMTAWIAVLNVPHEPLTAMLRVCNRFDLQAAYRVVLAASRLVFALCVWASTPSLAKFLYAELAARLVGALVLLASAHFAIRRQSLGLVWKQWSIGSLRADRKEIGQFLGLSYVTGSLRMVTSKGDTLILGVFTSSEVVGVFELAKRIVEQLMSMATPLPMAMFPETSRLVAGGDLTALRWLYRRFSAKVALWTVPFCAAFAIVAPWAFPLIGGTDYQESGTLAQILIWQLLMLPVLWFPGYLLTRGKLRIFLSMLVLDTVIYTLVLVSFSFWFAATGAAIAATLRSWIWIGMSWWVFHRVHAEKQNTNFEYGDT